MSFLEDEESREREMGVQFSTETVGAEDGQQSDDFIYLYINYIYIFMMAGRRMEGLCLTINTFLSSVHIRAHESLSLRN